MVERGNIVDGFFSVCSELQEVKFKNRDGIRQELSERAIGVGTQLRFSGVLENMRQSARDFREERISPAARGFGQLMRGIVKPDEVIPRGLGLDRQSGVLPQILQVLGRILQELFERAGIVGSADPSPSTPLFPPSLAPNRFTYTSRP